MKTTNIRAEQQSKSKSTRATAPAEFKIVRLRECPMGSPLMQTPDAVEKVWREHVATADWFKADKECLVVFLLNTRRHLIGFETLSQGSRDTLLVNTGEVFRMAAARDAAAIVIAHNHPSGDPSPSDADIKVTRDLIRAGELLKVKLLDHVIIGAETNKKSRQSLRELGYFYLDSGELSKAIVASAKKPEAPGTLVPSEVVKEMQAANAELNLAGSAAVATGLLNAAHILASVKNFGGWADFETPRLEAGVFETVQTIGKAFDAAFVAWESFSRGIIERILDCDAPLKIVPNELCDHKLLERFRKQDVSLDIENAVNALKQCVYQQGNVMDERNKDEAAFFLSQAIKERLARAFDSAWAAKLKLKAAFFAVHEAGQSKPEAVKLAA